MQPKRNRGVEQEKNADEETDGGVCEGSVGADMDHEVRLNWTVDLMVGYMLRAAGSGSLRTPETTAQ